MARTGKTASIEVNGMHGGQRHISSITQYSNSQDTYLTLEGQMVMLDSVQVTQHFAAPDHIRSVEFSGQGFLIPGEMERHSVTGAKEVDEDERTELVTLIEQLHLSILHGDLTALKELKKWYADVFYESPWAEVEVPS